MRLLTAALTTILTALLLSMPAAAGAGRHEIKAAGADTQSDAGISRDARRQALAALGAGAAGERGAAVRLLILAAFAGDDLALVRLEQMRRKGEPGAPPLSDLVEIERVRAERGDPVTAWRLARRYRDGDGVAASTAEMIRWLRVAGDETAGDYPKARDAAYRLCEIYGRGDGAPADLDEARDWCARAAGAGHKGAAMVIARLRGVDE